MFAALMRFALSLLVSAPFFTQIVAAQNIDLDSVIGLIDQDSLTANIAALQSFDKEICNDYDARSWIFEKMGAADLDSSYIDYFHLGIWGCNFDYRYKGNVIGVKRGSTHPHHLIVISAKYDSNPGSPGADDNCSGAAAVLEIARVLRQVDTRMTVVMALFDGGTWAHLGAWNYATRIKRQSDSIVLALNLDQIGGGTDSVRALLGYRGDSQYADLMRTIADSLPNIDLDCIPDSGSGDEATYPFEFNGFRALRVSEYEPSPVAGGPTDSLQYLNMNYLTRMTKAALATAGAVDNSYDYTPGFYVSFPQGVPLVAFPNRTRNFPVRVEAYGGATITPGGCRLCAAATGQHIACTPMEDLGNGDYLASMPAFPLRSRIRFHVAVTEQSLGTLTFTDEGEPFRAVGAFRADTIFHDDYEFDEHWMHGGDATVGAWHCTRMATGYFMGGIMPPCDRWGHGNAWNTGKDLLEDLDGGHATLRTLGIDMSAGDVATVELYLWFVNSYLPGTGEDVFDFQLCNDTALSWVLAKRVGPVLPSPGKWNREVIWINDFVELTNHVCLRYDVSDLGFDSPVEAAVDEVTFVVYSSDSTGPSITTDFLPDWTVSVPVLLNLQSDGGIGTITWSDAHGNLAGTGLHLAASGTLEGIPAFIGTITFIALAVDEYDNRDSASYTFTVNPALSITTTSLPACTLGHPVSIQVEHAGGTGAVEWATESEVLGLHGLHLEANGRLAGTPSDTGSFAFAVSARDMAGATDQAEFILKILTACGDVNSNGVGPDIADLTFLVRYLFAGGSAPDPAAADIDASGFIAITDITRFVDFLFRNGPALTCRTRG